MIGCWVFVTEESRREGKGKVVLNFIRLHFNANHAVSTTTASNSKVMILYSEGQYHHQFFKHNNVLEPRCLLSSCYPTSLFTDQEKAFKALFILSMTWAKRLTWFGCLFPFPLFPHIFPLFSTIKKIPVYRTLRGKTTSVKRYISILKKLSCRHVYRPLSVPIRFVPQELGLIRRPPCESHSQAGLTTWHV